MSQVAESKPPPTSEPVVCGDDGEPLARQLASLNPVGGVQCVGLIDAEGANMKGARSTGDSDEITITTTREAESS